VPEHPLYWRVAARAGFRCEYCRAPQIEFNARFELEHIVPQHRGGLTILGNLALACRSCNNAKRAYLAARDPVGGAWVWLFNPRIQSWSAHFALDPVTGVVAGLTPAGRATVQRLRMNSLEQRVARQVWILRGLFGG
jgi:hypothetical protein